MNKASIFLWVLTLFIIGAGLGAFLSKPGLNEYEKFFHSRVIIEGQIKNDPDVGDTQSKFHLLPLGSKEEVLVTTRSKQEFFYGDMIYLVGTIKKPEIFSNFNYPKFLQSQNIYAQISPSEVYILDHKKSNYFIYYALRFKHILFKEFKKNMPPRESALLISLLTGQKNFLSAETIADFQATGTTHVIAVSGFTLTLIMLGFQIFIPYIGRRQVLFITFIVALLYIVIAGFAPGVLRAAIMSGLFLLSKTLGRKYVLLPSLLSTAVLLIFLNPLIVIYDLGFVFAFSSILGIYFFAPLCKQIFHFLPEHFGVKEIFASTISAQIATIPITIYYFNQISLVAPLSNLLILPIVGPASAFGYFCAMPIAGKFFAWFVVLPLNYILLIVGGLAKVKYSNTTMNINLVILVAVYLIEILVYFVLSASLKRKAKSGKFKLFDIKIRSIWKRKI
jgi:competence protein ComEC